MDVASAKRACSCCRLLKIKCCRSLPACQQCTKSGRDCAYPEARKIRFRDETNNATSLAIRKWRARSSKNSTSPDPTEKVQFEIAHDIVDVARQRFLYDFTETDNSPLGWEMRDKVLALTQSTTLSQAQQSVFAALDAVALANFGRRRKDSRANAMATHKHAQALSHLRALLSDPEQAKSLEATTTAVLLGLFQNVRRDADLIGSWVYHFCGAVNMVLQPRDGPRPIGHEFMLRLLSKQALHTSFRIHALVQLPAAVTAWMYAEQSLDARATRLAFQTADLYFRDLPHETGDFHLEDDLLVKAFSLDKQYQALNSDLQTQLTFESSIKAPEAYPKWFWPLSRHEGCPTTAPTYSSLSVVGVWNEYRIGHLYILARLLQTTPAYMSVTVFASKLAAATQIIDDICGSVYYCLARVGEGRASPNAFYDIPGAAPYALNLILRTVESYIINIPFLKGGIGQARLDWIHEVTEIFSDELGMSEAWIWRDEDHNERQAVLSQLSFTGSSSTKT